VASELKSCLDDFALNDFAFLCGFASLRLRVKISFGCRFAAL